MFDRKSLSMRRDPLMILAHKIRLNPTPEQATYFARAGTARFCFNWGPAEWKRQYEAGQKPNAFALKKRFNAIRKEQFPWTYEVTKCAVEGAFMDLGKAFKHFFDGLTSGRWAIRSSRAKSAVRRLFIWPTISSPWAIIGLMSLN
jgi:transposase